jgi:F-type H+-transporting ATPase subunit epsilon
VDSTGKESFIAVDEGVLLKAGDRVLVSVRDAVRGRHLGELRKTVEDRFMKLDEKEKTTRTTLAKLEGSFVRRFLEYQKHG